MKNFYEFGSKVTTGELRPTSASIIYIYVRGSVALV